MNAVGSVSGDVNSRMQGLTRRGVSSLTLTSFAAKADTDVARASTNDPVCLRH